MISCQIQQISATIVTDSIEQQNQHMTEVRRIEIKSMKTCIMIAFSYVLTAMPLSFYGIASTLLDFKSMYLNGAADGSRAYLHFDLMVTLIAFSNGIFDVIIFFFWNTVAKRKLRSVFQKVENEKMINGTNLRKLFDNRITGTV